MDYISGNSLSSSKNGLVQEERICSRYVCVWGGGGGRGGGGGGGGIISDALGWQDYATKVEWSAYNPYSLNGCRPRYIFVLN